MAKSHRYESVIVHDYLDLDEKVIKAVIEQIHIVLHRYVLDASSQLK
ncbi:hypothetical protein RT723_16485 [Psychrosphaera aquimarina]|uniref:DUF86 domain-containing protein n=1 Tax=Psychrosphaera aquimarina TaxID=2044854 RepID=A0ABU3R4I3_9GAMM|nr:hypothetical protein [Psychrosphaera aquimarina]MDU0114558.1 hypothetical protein [Psychrosphaera aquimarina]